MKTIISAPFRATRGIASGVIRPAADDGIDPAFRRDFPAYCEAVLERPENVIDFGEAYLRVMTRRKGLETK